ncbi:LmeA family phospholipid-binding protein [Serinibacter salmoneus]|uniref:DUF2993 family protein n=1 Tax=Serinibacter salmoneus TaxID=556530 RepID=A0A2A9D2X8_9MICO|nr:DUF2993 domain-containing protein [Serinibacter salmoneus]PFG21057.1 Protein of unknown function (DUF2993) [Serinibacter salmoneus]
MSAPRPRSRLRRALIIVVLALVALLVADRVTAAVVGSRISAVMTTDLAAQDARAGVAGFPFLTQLAAGELRQVNASAGSITLEGVELENVAVDASDLPIRGEVIAGSVSLAGTLPTTSLQGLVTEAVQERGGLVGAAVEVTVSTGDGVIGLEAAILGFGLLEVDVTPRADGDVIHLDITDVRLEGTDVDLASLPFGLGDLLLEALSDATPTISGLPPGMALTEVRVTDAGVRVRAVGSEVDLTAYTD